MNDPLRIDLPLLLPDVTDVADRCVERLLSELRGREGVQKVHALAATEGVRGSGLGKAIRATLSVARSPSTPSSIFSARLSIDCAAWALEALARILLAWSVL